MLKILKRHSIALALMAFVFIPFVTLAAPANFREVISLILDVINQLVRLVVVLALLFFLYNIFRMVFAGGNEESRKEAKTFMVYGIIALFVMVSVWGLVNILTSTLFGAGAFNVPQLK